MGKAACSLALAALLLATAAERSKLAGEEFTELLGLRLHHVNLTDVQNRLGDAELKETGEAGGYLATVCYADLPENTVVVFKSGEMGGPDHTLLGFELRRYEGDGDSDCVRLDPAVVESHGLRVGQLQLGLTRDAFSRAIGDLEELPGRGIGRLFTRRQAMTAEELVRCPQCRAYPYWDVDIAVSGEFRDEALVRLAVWKTVTS